MRKASTKRTLLPNFTGSNPKRKGMRNLASLSPIPQCSALNYRFLVPSSKKRENYDTKK